MSGITYPSGPQTLAIPTTILLPSAATPFNPSTVNPSVEACWDAIKAEEYYGCYKTTFDAAQPPYPAGGSFINAGAYKFSGTNAFVFTSTGVDMLTHSAPNLYGRSANILAHYDDAVWDFLYDAPIKAKYKATSTSSTSPVTFEFSLPDSITLEQVLVRVEPTTHSALPAVMPRVYVWMTDNTLGTTTLLTPAVSDTSATFVDYNIPHNILVTLPSTVFSARKNSVIVEVYGESSTDAQNGLVVCIPRIEYERTRIAEEFGEWIP